MMTKRKRGRPPTEVPADLAQEALDWISKGNPLSEWCRLPGKVDRSTVHRWAEKDTEFAQRLAHARDLGYDEIALDIIRLAETKPLMFVDPGGYERVDQGSVAWHRLRVDTRMKLLACWSPNKYGNRVALDHAGGVSINVVTGVPID